MSGSGSCKEHDESSRVRCKTLNVPSPDINDKLISIYIYICRRAERLKKPAPGFYGARSLMPSVEMRFYNRFICVGVDISMYALLTGGRS